MSDAGEALVDEDSRIQERMHERALERRDVPRRGVADVERVRAVESLRLARIELERQLATTGDERRRVQLARAIEEVGRRMDGMRDPTPDEAGVPA
jgi:hypothetical protein